MPIVNLQSKGAPNTRAIGYTVNNQQISILSYQILSPNEAHIMSLVTNPKFEGHGFATKLIESMKRRFYNLSTIPATEKLKSFYCKRGFRAEDGNRMMVWMRR